MKTRLDVYETEYKNMYCFDYRNEFGQTNTTVLNVYNDEEMKLYINCFKTDIIETCFNGKFVRLK